MMDLSKDTGDVQVAVDHLNELDWGCNDLGRAVKKWRCDHSRYSFFLSLLSSWLSNPTCPPEHHLQLVRSAYFCCLDGG